MCSVYRKRLGRIVYKPASHHDIVVTLSFRRLYVVVIGPFYHDLLCPPWFLMRFATSTPPLSAYS